MPVMESAPSLPPTAVVDCIEQSHSCRRLERGLDDLTPLEFDLGFIATAADAA